MGQNRNNSFVIVDIMYLQRLQPGLKGDVGKVVFDLDHLKNLIPLFFDYIHI